MNNLAPKPQPTPTPDQWPGVLTVHSADNYDVGVHKAGSAIATVGVSLIASGVFAVTGHESPMLNLENERDRHVVEVSRTTTSTYEPNHFMGSTSKRVGTKPALRQEHTTIEKTVLMPDVPGFDLMSDPAAQRLVSPEGFTSFVLGIKAAQDKGWTVTSVARASEASDEARTDDNAGLGRPNPANEKLAEQYGKFAGDLFEDETAKAGVDLSKASMTAVSNEAVLTSEELAIFDAEAQRLGFADASQFVATYKANPGAMDAAAKGLMDNFVTAARGAAFSVQLSRTSTVEEGVYHTTETYRCIEERRTDIETKVLPPVTDHIPIFAVPVPVPAWRRKRRTEDVQSETPTDTETSIPRVLPPGVKDVHQMRRERMDPGGIGAGIGLDREATQKKTRGDLEVRGDVEWTGGVKRTDWAERIARQARNDRIAKWILGGIGLTLTALAATTRFEAAHCPEKQGVEWDETTGFSIYFENPFTGSESDRFVISPPICDVESGEAKPDGGNGGDQNSGPTCDTRELVYQDGVLISDEETHHPGAITIIEK